METQWIRYTRWTEAGFCKHLCRVSRLLCTCTGKPGPCGVAAGRYTSTCYASLLLSGSKARPGPRDVAAGRLADRPLTHPACRESRFTVWQGTIMSCQGTIKSPNASPPSRKLNFRLVWMPLLPLPRRSNVEVQANTSPLPANRSTLSSRGSGDARV